MRLTGRHPFNVEPPVWRIKDHGFISPNSLHYVRNHGAVPRIVQGDSHKVGGGVGGVGGGGGGSSIHTWVV